MRINVLEYLEDTVTRVPDKTAYANGDISISFQEVYDRARAIGTFLYQEGIYKQPVVVFMNRHPKTVTAYYGVMYGGNFYVPIDDEMSQTRIELILKNVNPLAIICEDETKKVIEQMDYSGNVYNYDDIIKTEIDTTVISTIRNASIDTDPAYIVYTSGSTGVPKGVLGSHRALIDYIEDLSDVLEFNENTVFGNQTPLYLDACFKELIPTIKYGATTYIIPKSLFMFPIKLVEYLNEHKINTICWVVTALTMISSFKVLDKLLPKYLHTIAFGSEVFPMKQFHMWRNALPNASFINLYGPTEATGMSCYYKVDRDFKEDEVIPIGNPFRNTDILLLGNDDKLVEEGEIGEICIRGTSLALGYYQDFERTSEVFTQNPLNESYPELIYRTGDLGKYNDRKELVFVSRKDHQIKHMGYRIELGEIEATVNAIESINSTCCIYDKDRKKIVLYYVGNIDSNDVLADLKERLPRHMLPNRIEKLEKMPLTTNGKIDRVLLKENTLNKKRGNK